MKHSQEAIWYISHQSTKHRSSIEHGYQDISPFYGYVGPLECIFMAPLALFIEGVPGHFFHLMEAPMTRLQNAKMLLCWPSRRRFYGFV